MMADISLNADSQQKTAVSTNPSRDKKPPSPDFFANLLMLGVILLLFVTAGLLVHAVRQLPNAPIVVEPQGLTDRQYATLTKLLGSQASDNFLQTELEPYIQQLQQVSWVEQVDVQRDWQQGLKVSVVARQPVAKFGSQRMVDANGVVFKPVDSRVLDAKHWMQLQGDDKNAVVMMQQVKQVADWYQPLGLKVEEVILTPRMAWLFRFDNGLRVLVDNEDTSEKLYQLSVMLQHQLKDKLPTIQTVDLRYKNGMAVTWRDSASASNSDNAANPSVPNVPAVN